MKRSVPLLLAVLLFALLSLTGCASSSETGEGEARPRRRAAAPEAPGLELLAPSEEARTVQLYPGDDETQLPIVGLRSGRKLTLEFDLVNDAGRPLSVFFYHADRTWERDLSPSEYLSSFQHDDLFDYTPSHSTQVPYAHYAYTFPNESIDFRISGNYVLRVTEQGSEDEVLFERAFFVTENAAEVELGVEPLLVGGQNYPSAQPVASVLPNEALVTSVFDFNVCFVQNGQVEGARCSDQPSLASQPTLLFYLQPEYAFEPQAADFFLDFSALQIGGDIEDVDRSVVPYGVVLEPDYARFPDSGSEPLLRGQAVVTEGVRDVGDPDVQAEYASVRFSYVPPDERPVQGGVYIVGSFNGWVLDLGQELDWVAERGRYEGELLIKEGLYEYRYTSPDPRLRRLLRSNLPRPENEYTAFVYFADASLNTDRLLAVHGVRSR